MGLWNTMREPVFLKTKGSAEKQLAALKTMRMEAKGRLLEQIDREIRIVEAGIYGENQILFELKNSHMPMVVMHDLYFEQGDFTAQIDYLIITRGRRFVLECKNLIGNIEIDRDGNFTRTFYYGGQCRTEGIYSPITQNQRHMELIKRIRSESKGNPLSRAVFERQFAKNYRSLIVLANPKTVLNAKFAKEDVKSQVIRADQLISYIRNANMEAEAESMSARKMRRLAEFFFEQSVENPTDYEKKYKEQWEAEPIPKFRTNRGSEGQEPTASKSRGILCPRCGAPMVRRTASRGLNAGKEFYGCSDFPRCRGTVSID